jgi:hypothetical protein
MDDVVSQQKNAAIADYSRSLPQLGADAQRAGGLGGTRSALVQAEGQRNLQNQLANIQATGSQSAFQNAQQQFNQQQQASLQAQQANQGAALQNAGQYAQYGLGGAQLGIQGLGQQLNAAGQLGNIGQQQFQQQAGINTALLGTGALQQQQNQSLLNQGYQNYQNQLNYPYNQLTFLRNMIQPTAMNSQSTVYGGQANTAGQVAGLGMGLGSLFGAMG